VWYPLAYMYPSPHAVPDESRTCCPSMACCPSTTCCPSMTCCPCLRAWRSRPTEESAILPAPSQTTPAVSPVEPPEVHYQVPTVATAQVISAHGSENTEYAYTDITNHPPQPDASGPLYAELLHPPPRTHGNSNLSYADPADMVLGGDRLAVYDPVCPGSSPSYDIPTSTEYSSESVSQYLSLPAHSSPARPICTLRGCTQLC